MNSTPTFFKISFGIFFGALVAGAYLFAKFNGAMGGLDLLTYGCFIAFVGHLLAFPRLTLHGLKDPKMCLRGALWGLTQVFIFAAQEKSATSSALIGAVMGSIFGILLGRLILREKLSRAGLCAAVLAISAVFLDPHLFKDVSKAVMGGFIQGLSMVTARSLMISNKSIRQSISTGFFIGGSIGLALMLAQRRVFEVRPDLAINIGIVIAMLLVIQYSYFQLIRMLDTQRTSVLLLTRIPWAIAAEAIFLGTQPGSRQLVAGTCIIAGSLLLILESFAALPTKRRTSR